MYLVHYTVCNRLDLFFVLLIFLFIKGLQSFPSSGHHRTLTADEARRTGLLMNVLNQSYVCSASQIFSITDFFCFLFRKKMFLRNY